MEEDAYVTSSDEDDELVEKPPRQPRGANLSWEPEASFPTHDEAREAVTAEGTWRLKYKSDSAYGKRHIYVCSFYKARSAIQCPARVSLLLQAESQETSFERQGEHAHDGDGAAPETTGISVDDRALIDPAGAEPAEALETFRILAGGLHCDDWATFCSWRDVFWVLRIGADWKDTSCTCPVFLKRYVCRHSLGLCLRKKLCTSPPEAKTQLFGAKRKRGRPAKARPALIVQ